MSYNFRPTSRSYSNYSNYRMEADLWTRAFKQANMPNTGYSIFLLPFQILQLAVSVLIFLVLVISSLCKWIGSTSSKEPVIETEDGVNDGRVEIDDELKRIRLEKFLKREEEYHKKLQMTIQAKKMGLTEDEYNMYLWAKQTSSI